MITENSKFNSQNLSKNHELIIVGAKELFLEKGLNAVSMNDIVEVTGFSRKTLYRHFENKENLAFEVLKQIYDDLLQRFSQIESPQEFETGFDELSFKLHKYMEILIHSLQEVSFLVEYDHYIESGYEQYDMYLEKINLIHDTIERGLRDGSIRNDNEINDNLSFVLCESCLGFVYRYQLRKQSGAKLRIQSSDLNHFVDLLLLSVKAEK
ncbi:TetR/AcrR family transcriptional regulator [Bacillus massiliigorillae]|uniref:TetR/AcrR family transcriptional regulator n=1 Tax=Bacillus massiliigorillae TaxID=1243664 RepID=UPI00039E98F5|nr:TetR/AcrR family transcriptional regulator [Bacillus massiliigorillae]